MKVFYGSPSIVNSEVYNPVANIEFRQIMNLLYRTWSRPGRGRRNPSKNERVARRLCGVLYRRFMLGMTFEECAKDLGISRDRARQLESKAIRILRHPSLKVRKLG